MPIDDLLHLREPKPLDQIDKTIAVAEVALFLTAGNWFTMFIQLMEQLTGGQDSDGGLRRIKLKN